MDAPTKAEWRRRARSARAALAIDHDAHLEALAEFLRGLDTAPRWVVTFDPMTGEVDLGRLPARCPGVGFAVTRTPETGRDLTVHPVGGRTERHRFGFLQPTADTPVVPDDALDVVLVPGLAFDRLGNRLGHGAGYYDRFLGRLRQVARSPVHLVGITAGYVVAELPTADHDVPMTHLCGPFGVEPVPLADPIG